MNSNILGLIGSFCREETGATISSTTASSPQLPLARVDIAASRAREKDEPPAYSVIIFSKNRPFQLHALLQSIDAFFLEPPANIYVIYTSSDEWNPHYEAVFEHAAGVVTPVLESDFSNDVEECCSRTPDNGYIMFCVDDLVFYDHVSMSDISRCLVSCPSLYGVHTKLHPGICFSHASTRACLPPLLQCVGEGILGFNFRSSNADWAYPFDLCGCVYRAVDVGRILSLIKVRDGASGCRNPNVLEVSGNSVMAGVEFKCASMGGCLSRPVCSVITVNRVQCTFDVPIYDTAGGGLATLNSYILPLIAQTQKDDQYRVNAGAVIDYASYRSTCRLSVHIEDLHLQSGMQLTQHTVKNNSSFVSVVIPLCNGMDFVSGCLQSLLNQTYEHFEVICVLNGCTDNTEELCLSFKSQFAEKGLMLKVLVLVASGLVEALQAGLAVVGESSVYVSRLDVDDRVISPLHLVRQVEFLDANPHINVLGTQSFLTDDLSAAANTAGSASMCVAMGIPTHPVLVQWEMMFRCVVLHPTVMLRRNVVESCGGYGNHFSLESNCAEDYVLWARILQSHPFSVANLAQVDVCIFQHADSKSSIERATSRVEELKIQWCLAKSLLTKDLILPGAELFAIFSRLHNPEHVSSLSEIKEVCKMIHLLHENFVATIPTVFLGDDVLFILKESKIKIAVSFLRKCVHLFSVEGVLDELAMLDISPALLLKHQISFNLNVEELTSA